MTILKMATLASVSIGIMALAVTSNASAHVVVKPAEVVTAGFQTFTIGVPNEKSVPTTSIKLDLPAGLTHVSPTQKAGWTIDITRDGTGEDAVVTSITWSGDEIKAGFRDDFTFSAQVPAIATDLQWKAYQTYADGVVVSWDQANAEGYQSNSGPFSVTKVVPMTAADTATVATEQVLTNTKRAADNALYVGIAGGVVGLVAIYLGTRKR